MIEVNSILAVEKFIDGVDVVIFDLDDTLYPEKEYVRSGYRKIAEWLGEANIEEQLWTVFLHGGRAIDEVLPEKLRDEALNICRYQEPDIQLYSGVKGMLEPSII